jgi:hypothetical protein
MKLLRIKETGTRKGMAVVGLAGLLALAGCATTSAPVGSEASPQGAQGVLTPERQVEIVKKRFQERWDAMIARDYAKAYTYLSPATRALMTELQFTSRFSRGQFKKAEFLEAKCEEDACIVRFVLTYDHKMAKGIDAQTGEKWFFRDGEAWFNLSE